MTPDANRLQATVDEPPAAQLPLKFSARRFRNRSVRRKRQRLDPYSVPFRYRTLDSGYGLIVPIFEILRQLRKDLDDDGELLGGRAVHDIQFRRLRAWMSGTFPHSVYL